MNTDLQLPSISLRRSLTHRIPSGRGLRVQCLAGTIWLTQHDEPRDIVLEPGEAATIERDGLSLVTALSDARFLLLSPLH